VRKTGGHASSDEPTSVEDFPVVPSGPAQGAKFDLDAHTDPGLSDDEIVQKLIHGDRPRFGSGELVRDMRKRRRHHECQKPTGRFTRGDVWRCDCGRRYTWRTLGHPRNEGWLRRHWPWPR